MFKLFKTILKTGEATVRYPFAPLPVAPNFRGRPKHDPQQCIACAACTMACPANALTMRTDAQAATQTWSLFIGRCIFCGRCEEVCPTKAIVLSEDFELAVARRQDMFQEATFKAAHCIECGQAFAPAKEIDYTLALLAQAGMQGDGGLRAKVKTCPECKRRSSLPETGSVSLGQHLQKETVG